MHSSISIGLGRNPLDPSGPHSNPNYSDFIWCSPSSSSSVGVSDENNYNSHDINYHHSLSRNDIQISPQSHSYYDFLPHHHHHNFHHNLSSTNNSQNSPNGFHSISGHNNSYRSNSSGLAGHYGPPCTLDPIRSEPEECCSGTEYYMPGTRSPGSGYEVWNCHSSSLNNEGTSVGHPSPDDPLLISPNDEEGNEEGGDGIVEMGEDNGSTLVTTRPPRRRNTANKKERRRTMSINNAFADLRDCIPNVPADTKLSKSKIQLKSLSSKYNYNSRLISFINCMSFLTFDY